VVGKHAGKLKEAIHRFKYRDNPALNACMGQLMTSRLDTALDDFQPEMVIPVPSHPQRLRKRGYNQALELARPVAKHLQIPLAVNLLSRAKSSKDKATSTAPSHCQARSTAREFSWSMMS
jgi:predicted amidophosphoribosyltransferase